MERFTLSDLRKRAGKLVIEAELGHLSLVTKRGQPVLAAVPFDESLFSSSVRMSIAV